VAVTTAAMAARRRVRALGTSRGPAGPGPRPWLAGAGRLLGVPDDPQVVFHLSLGGATAWAVVLVVAGPAVAALAVAGAVGAGVAWRRGATRRQAAADELELPHLLERVARHLRAGGSLRQAFAAATPPASPGAPPDGLAAAWRSVADRSTVVGLVPALDEWAEGVGGGRPSIGLAVAALAVAAATGGSPARAVDGVASTLRSRLAVAEEVRALSSQARASATVIALAPVGFGALAAATDDRTAAFLSSPAGVVLAATGLALDAVGAWWMARLCRVRP
jgi:tight adherence protein B